MPQGSQKFSDVIIGTCVTFLCIAAPCLAETQPTDAEIVVAITKSMNDDLETLRKAHLQGTLKCIGLDEHDGKITESSFDCYLLEARVRNDSVNKSKSSSSGRLMFDRVHSLLFADNSFAVTRFSSTIKPTGSETTIHTRRPNIELLNNSHFTMWYLPSELRQIPFNPQRDLIDAWTFSRQSDGIVKGTLKPIPGIRHEVMFDRNLGYRPIVVQVFWKDRLIEHFAMKWKQWDGVWMFASIDNTSDQKKLRVQWTIEKFELPATIDPQKFTEADLGELPGSRVIDERDLRHGVIIHNGSR